MLLTVLGCSRNQILASLNIKNLHPKMKNSLASFKSDGYSSFLVATCWILLSFQLFYIPFHCFTPGAVTQHLSILHMCWHHQWIHCIVLIDSGKNRLPLIGWLLDAPADMKTSITVKVWNYWIWLKMKWTQPLNISQNSQIRASSVVTWCAQRIRSKFAVNC